MYTPECIPCMPGRLPVRSWLSTPPPADNPSDWLLPVPEDLTDCHGDCVFQSILDIERVP